MSEHNFVKRIHRHLPREVYRWKIADRYTNGVPDAWYSGDKGDLWVEYKYLPRTPKRGFTPALTALQRKWLIERSAEGRNVAVIVGSPDGAVILTGEDIGNTINQRSWMPITEVIEWITNACLSTKP